MSSSNLKKKNCNSDKIKRNISHPSSKAEPKVVYVPNIAINSEDKTISIVSYKPISILRTILKFSL